MSWSPPATWATGQTISGSTAAANTSVSLNFQLRDNLMAARRGWDAGIHLSLGGAQSVSNNVNQAVTWDVLDWQFNSTNTLWASASGSKLLAPIGGWYELGGALEYNSNASGYRGSAWRINGTTLYQIATIQNEATGRTFNVPLIAVVPVTTADYVQVMAFQNTGAALPLHGGLRDRTRVSWRFLGGAT